MKKNILVHSGLLAAAGAIVWAAGCDHRRTTTDRDFERTNQAIRQEAQELHGKSYDTARGGGPEAAGTPAGAIVSLAEARCAREERCNNVGQGRRYETQAACLNGISESRRDDLNLGDCPRGVDQRKLASCLGEVRNEDCGNALDTVSRIVSCRSSELCLH